MIAALLIGFGLGASVAAQLGPMSLLTIRSTLRSGVWVGRSSLVSKLRSAYRPFGAWGGEADGRSKFSV